jgi:hypothetical protein
MPDGIVIVISLFVLAIIVAIVLPLSQKAAADPFVDVGAVTPERTAYIERGVSLYNKFSDTNDVTKGNYLQSWDPAALAEGDQDLKAASMTSDLVPDGMAPTGQGIEVRGPTMKIAQSNRVYFDTEKCEKQRGRDVCSKLGSGDFSQCGVCIKGGTAYIDPDNPGKHIGGMLLLNEDKEMADLAVRGTSNPAEYEPTVGECPRGYFYVDRAACEKAVKRENCNEIGATGGFDGGKTVEMKGIDSASCAAVPSVSPTTYVYDPKNRVFGAALRILTPERTGRNVIQIFKDGARISYAAGLGGTEIVIGIPNVKEGMPLQVVINMDKPYTPYNGAGNYRAVLIQWESNDGSIVQKFEPSIVSLNGSGRDADAVLPNMRKYGTFGSSKVILTPRPSSVTRDSYVVLYEHKDFGGSSHKFYAGSYDVGDLELGGLRNDLASSITLVNGATAKLYENGGFRGKMIDVKRNISEFDSIDFNDKLSSLIVEPGKMKAASLIKPDNQWFWAVGSPQVLRIDVKVPGTFLQPFYTEDRQSAISNPLVTERSTFEMLRASPCMKPDQKPGKYGYACLKTLYLAAGGILGKGTLSRDGLEQLNKFSSAEAISEYLDGLFQTATRGRKSPDAKASSMEDINDAAMKLFGFKLVSPCEDIVESETGELILTPKVGGLDADCLDYLWKNTGNDRDRGNEDTSRKSSLKNTYVSIRDRYSGLRASEGSETAVAAKPFQTCQPSGTLAPKNARGEVNYAAVMTANAKGSLEAIQDFYNTVHSAANYSGGRASMRTSHEKALEQCYGIKKAAQTVTKVLDCPRPPLLTPGTRISLSPSSVPTLFARHAGFVMWTHGNDGSYLFRNDATFKVAVGIGGTPGRISFESVNFPGYYVVHMNFRVMIYAVGANLDFNGRPGKRDAEWKVVPGINRVANTYSFESNYRSGYYLGKVGDEIRIVQFNNRNGGDISWFVKPGIL